MTGKGELQTYWLEIKSGRYSAHGSSHDDSSTAQLSREEELLDIGRGDEGRSYECCATKLDRLTNWNVGMLSSLLKQIIARRRASGQLHSVKDFDAKVDLTRNGGTVLDEVQEIITLPDFDEKTAVEVDPETIELDPDVVSELREFVQCIAMLYKNNPFHNFEHASHVVMSSMKLLGRIVAPTEIEYDKMDSQRHLASALHHHSYGITSDPLTQFSCCFCALIHDAGASP